LHHATRLDEDWRWPKSSRLPRVYQCL